MLEINNRRYVGSKTSLLVDIFDVVNKYFNDEEYTIADLFAGTGVVSTFFLNKGKNVIVNDILLSNYIAYQTWFGDGKYDSSKLIDIIANFNNIIGANLAENYFSSIYAGKYFSSEDAKKIGYIREEIAAIELTERERYILITSLMYAADKIANTVGHFEHFLSKEPESKDIIMKFPNIGDKIAQIHLEDANELVKKIKPDVVYLDPPYNARQYINFYHVLENLARWEKPTEFEGTSMKFKRNHLKSDYSKAKAPVVMQELINDIEADLIVVSYNNTYNANSNASNNKIKEDQMEVILGTKGEIIEKRTINHKYFNSGKTNFNDHKEYLYVCKVN